MAKHNGFTLIEIAIVLAIISITLSIAFPSLVCTCNDTREMERARQEYVINKALREYYALTGAYPNPGHDSSMPNLTSEEINRLEDALQKQTGVNLDLTHYAYTYNDTNGDGAYEISSIEAERK
ncbi:type II secretion system protein [Desulfitobacterium sp. AusDCA]|uniref:type II secretion system protein n=1 Tax=Desulfitobacterium sp. AusDCA TaxID=3240383 RepID=UPI003DA79EC8